MSVSFSVFDANDHMVGADESCINMANGNAQMVMSALGYEIEEGYVSVPLDEFINRCRSWLRRNIDKLSREIEDVVSGNVIDCGVPEGYLNQRILQLVILAEQGKTQGGVRISGC